MNTMPVPPTPVSPMPMTSAALITMRGVPNVWRLCVGDYMHHLEQLRHFSPFDAELVAIAPRTRPDPEEVVLAAAQRLAYPCENGWFHATADVAFAIFQAVLPTDWHDPPPPPTPVASDDVAMSVPADDTTSAAPLTQGEEVDPQLWEHVEPCTTRQASKAADIRTALVAKLGKTRAIELLSKTRATVAKDTQGQNNRVLRANGTLLKLKTSAQ